jgi:hypothetical protein
MAIAWPAIWIEAMTSRLPFVATALLLAFAPACAVRAQSSPSASERALVDAGKRATLGKIDYGEKYCDGAMTVEAWLSALVGKQARSIVWTGGDCVLVSDLRPGIDTPSWPYCAQATVTLLRPINSDDTPMIEIYFEKPAGGRPGVAYAFRAVLETPDGDPDYIRFRKEFEGGWDERFPPDAATQRCKNE